VQPKKRVVHCDPGDFQSCFVAVISTVIYTKMVPEPIGLPIAFSGNRSQAFVIHPDGTELTQVTNSGIGVLDILPTFDGGIYWEEGYENRSGSHSRGFNRTKLDGSETKDLDSWMKPAISNNGAYVAYLAHIQDCFGSPISLVVPVSRLDIRK
jgi:hypothetical protein